jgi:8-amino-7-oxononanoate synthase
MSLSQPPPSDSAPQSLLPQSVLDDPLRELLQNRRDTGLLRIRKTVKPLDSTHLEIAGRRCVNFASNNYLGLTHHPRLLARVSAESEGIGSGAAALVSGYTDAHAKAEAAIAKWKGTESAVLLSSGYQANLAAIQTLAALSGHDSRDVRFLIDKLSHASLIDAVRATQLPFRVFPHNHLGKLERLLADSPPGQMQVVITESIFSMDGDSADLHGLAELKRRHPFVLVVDEAHACGVYGPGGSGLLAEMELTGLADVSIATLSKAIGAIGGAVCGSDLFCQALVNFGRAYIYSTAIPPHIASLAIEAIAIMKDEPARQQRVRALALRLRGRLKDAALDVAPGDSPIIPIIMGDERSAIRAADQLLEEGFFVTAMRPPTVAPGTSRLRVTVSCDHTEPEVDQLARYAARTIGRHK